MINVIHRFSVKPKKNYNNLSMSKIYKVLYAYAEENFDVYVVRGDDGTPESLRYHDVTVEDVQ